MINWRKPLILAGLTLSGSKIPRYLKEVERVSLLSKDEIAEYQQAKLERLLIHAYQNVPYYHRVLPKAGVISEGKVNLEHFADVPLLTKDIIRKEGENLYSQDYKSRHPYKNSSGGSTGEPVQILQDKQYDEYNNAIKIYFNRMLGKDIGEKELKFWGSERDIFTGSIGLKNKIINFIYNRAFINSFMIQPSDYKEIVNKWNSIKPKVVWSYVDSVYEFAKYVHQEKIQVYSPEAIIVTAGVLTEDIRAYIEDILKSPVYNQYGSREVGVIACECKWQKGLHVFQTAQYLELLNADPQGNAEVVITNLNNYSMPLIRYNIGDTAKVLNELCPCQRSLQMLKTVTGRITNHFIKRDGTIIHGEYFTHLFYFNSSIIKFQVIQDNYDHIVCKLVLRGDIIDIEDNIRDIKKKIQLVMGEDCEIEFEFVDEILPTKSGKYRYTICEIE